MMLSCYTKMKICVSGHKSTVSSWPHKYGLHKLQSKIFEKGYQTFFKKEQGKK